MRGMVASRSFRSSPDGEATWVDVCLVFAHIYISVLQGLFAPLIGGPPRSAVPICGFGSKLSSRSHTADRSPAWPSHPPNRAGRRARNPGEARTVRSPGEAGACRARRRCHNPSGKARSLFR